MFVLEKLKLRDCTCATAQTQTVGIAFFRKNLAAIPRRPGGGGGGLPLLSWINRSPCHGLGQYIRWEASRCATKTPIPELSRQTRTAEPISAGELGAIDFDRRYETGTL